MIIKILFILFFISSQSFNTSKAITMDEIKAGVKKEIENDIKELFGGALDEVGPEISKIKKEQENINPPINALSKSIKLELKPVQELIPLFKLFAEELQKKMKNNSEEDLLIKFVMGEFDLLTDTNDKIVNIIDKEVTFIKSINNTINVIKSLKNFISKICELEKNLFKKNKNTQKLAKSFFYMNFFKDLKKINSFFDKIIKNLNILKESKLELFGKTESKIIKLILKERDKIFKNPSKFMENIAGKELDKILQIRSLLSSEVKKLTADVNVFQQKSGRLSNSIINNVSAELESDIADTALRAMFWGRDKFAEVVCKQVAVGFGSSREALGDVFVGLSSVNKSFGDLLKSFEIILDNTKNVKVTFFKNQESVLKVIENLNKNFNELSSHIKNIGSKLKKYVPSALFGYDDIIVFNETSVPVKLTFFLKSKLGIVKEADAFLLRSYGRQGKRLKGTMLDVRLYVRKNGKWVYQWKATEGIDKSKIKLSASYKINFYVGYFLDESYPYRIQIIESKKIKKGNKIIQKNKKIKDYFSKKEHKRRALRGKIKENIKKIYKEMTKKEPSQKLIIKLFYYGYPHESLGILKSNYSEKRAIHKIKEYISQTSEGEEKLLIEYFHKNLNRKPTNDEKKIFLKNWANIEYDLGGVEEYIKEYIRKTQVETIKNYYKIYFNEEPSELIIKSLDKGWGKIWGYPYHIRKKMEQNAGRFKVAEWVQKYKKRRPGTTEGMILSELCWWKPVGELNVSYVESVIRDSRDIYEIQRRVQKIKEWYKVYKTKPSPEEMSELLYVLEKYKKEETAKEMVPYLIIKRLFQKTRNKSPRDRQLIFFVEKIKKNKNIKDIKKEIKTISEKNLEKIGLV